MVPGWFREDMIAKTCKAGSPRAPITDNYIILDRNSPRPVSGGGGIQHRLQRRQGPPYDTQLPLTEASFRQRHDTHWAVLLMGAVFLLYLRSSLLSSVEISLSNCCPRRADEILMSKRTKSYNSKCGQEICASTLDAQVHLFCGNIDLINRPTCICRSPPEPI